MNLSRILSRMKSGFLLAALLVLAACGGGGGGGGGNLPALIYTGNTNVAVITTGNAAKITANVVGNGDAPAIIAGIVGIAVVGGDSAQLPGGGLGNVARRLNRGFRGTLLQPGKTSLTSQPTFGVIPIESTELCDSGSMRTFGTLSDSGLGTLSVTYNDCRIGGDTMTGSATMRVDAIDLAIGLPTDATFDFSRLRFRGTSGNLDLSGTLRSQLGNFSNTETLTTNFVALDNNTGQMTKVENLVFVHVYDNIFLPTSFTEAVSGRVFDSVHGFVDITTISPLVFGTLDQLYPASGQFVLKGAPIGVGNRSIMVSALSSTMVWLELDLDGDRVREITAFLKWTELSGPVGADLVDNDGDGMHNSWEMANGLHPNDVSDAALDKDNDGFSNVREYRGGGDPGNAGVVPSMGKASLTLATGISTADSNESNPGRPGLASDGSKYLLVSCRELGTSPGIFGVFVSGATAGEPFLIASGDCRSLGGTSENSISLPNVAFDGTNYLVVFVKGAIIRGTRVTSSGSVLDGPDGFAISTGQLFSISSTSPAVAFDGSNYLVVWSKFIPITGVGTRNIFGATVTPAGQVSSEIPISTEQNTAPEQLGFALELGNPSLAFDGTNYLVMWNKVRTGPGTSIYSLLFAVYTDVSGARITPQGVVLDPQGIVFSTSGPLSQSPGAENVQVAFDGTNYLAVWRKVSTIGFDPPSAEIRGTRITPNGSMLDGPASGAGIGISTIVLGKSEPAVVFDGTNFLVTWVVGAFSNSSPAGMFGAKVSPGGQVVEGLPTTTGISLSGQPPPVTRFHFPVVSSNGASVLLTWVNNIEQFGQTKSIAGSLIFP